MDKYVNTLVRRAKECSYELVNIDTATKNKCLEAMGQSLIDNKDYILAQNLKDVQRASKKKKQKSFIDRLTLTEKRLQEMSQGLKEIASLTDPIGAVITQYTRPNGLSIKKVRAPIGVILVIYEARPNVTSDCIGLLFKSSNVAILRGGSDAINSNVAIAKVLEKALHNNGIEHKPFFVIEKTGYVITDMLLKRDDSIDLVIPRGGEELIRKVVENSRIPVIKHYKGVCHIFIDNDVDIGKALKICVNAKVQRPSVCNAVEKILVHKDIAEEFLPLLKKEFDNHGVEIRSDSAANKILKNTKKATKKDWFEEYLDLIVTVGIVADVDDAIRHINYYGSHHTDSILTKNQRNAERFVREVDSACCFVNISTRFSDGFQFGLGAEIGISTDKIHARGPMGLEELTTYKWVVEGDGQIRE
jgi:glutamate-5-semialdehyde dehydrogenase